MGDAALLDDRGQARWALALLLRNDQAFAACIVPLLVGPVAWTASSRRCIAVHGSEKIIHAKLTSRCTR